jgi:hypothetical protein
MQSLQADTAMAVPGPGMSCRLGSQRDAALCVDCTQELDAKSDLFLSPAKSAAGDFIPAFKGNSSSGLQPVTAGESPCLHT